MKLFYLMMIVIAISANYLSAQDGVLDGNFGNNGTATFNLFDNSSYIYSIVKTGDKIYAAGYTHPSTRDDFSIVRFTASGELDTDFGENGVLRPFIGSGYGVAQKILLQPDGKLVAAGWVRSGNKDLYVLARIHADGTLDDSFGEAGISKGSFSNSTYAEDEITDAALMSDGRILVSGRSYNGQNEDVFLGCIDENGDPCVNFGDEGVHIIEFEGGTSHYEIATALTVDDDDNIYLAGVFKVDLFDDNTVFIKKLNSQGVFDETFGTDGNILWSTESYIRVMTVDHEDRLLVAGGIHNPDLDNGDFFLTRFSLSGEVDSDFGENGIAMLDNGDDEQIYDIKLMPNGDIIAVGNEGFPSEFIVARVKDNGEIDPNFGTNGWTTTLLLSTFNGIESIYINPDGSILTGGYGYNGSVYRMALAQYTNTITSVKGPGFSAQSIEVFPNPASSLSTLTFSTLQPVSFSARMTDMEGRNLSFRLTERNLQSGEHSFEIPLKEVTTGNYLLIMNFGGVDVAKQIAVISVRD